MKCPNCGNTTDFDIKQWQVKCAKCGFNGVREEFWNNGKRQQTGS